MSVLTLRLAGPLQSWGAASRFTRRATEAIPTKSGILGLLAAAEGRRRSDPIEDLLDLELAVRTEQQGTILRDFHTAHHQVTGQSMPLTERFYWADAVFTAHIGGRREVLDGLADALSDPAYPIYLGRRSCVPQGRVVLGVEDCSVAESVRSVAWQPGYTRARRAGKEPSLVRLPVQADQSVFPDQVASRELNDVPLSFNPERRQYRSRVVVDLSVEIPNPFVKPTDGPTEGHDPMAVLEGAS